MTGNPRQASSNSSICGNNTKLAQTSLPYCHASQLTQQSSDEQWLIKDIWPQEAVGILGGPPKHFKSWLGLDLAISIASQTSFLERFDVKSAAPVLVYFAEDSQNTIRERIQGIILHRQLQLEKLPLFVITSPSLRLDLAQIQNQLRTTLAIIKPCFLLLDPLVRLHRLDENSSSDISFFLGFLRELQRTYNTSILLVHHSGKKVRADLGQSLRGSTDLHAFGDTNFYLHRKRSHVSFTVEHRSAPSIKPILLDLASRNDGSHTHLTIQSSSSTADSSKDSLETRILELLDTIQPMTRTQIRNSLCVQNERLGHALQALQMQDAATNTPKGWLLKSTSSNSKETPLIL